MQIKTVADICNVPDHFLLPTILPALCPQAPLPETRKQQKINQLFRFQSQLTKQTDFNGFILHWSSDFKDSVTTISAQPFGFFVVAAVELEQYYSFAPHLKLHLKHSGDRCKQKSVQVTQVSLQHLHTTGTYLHDF